MNKICSKCKISKSLFDFYKDIRGRLGRRSDCKQCVLALKQQYHLINKSKLNLKNKIWYENHPEYRREYYKANSQTISSNRRQRYKTDQSFRQKTILEVKNYRSNPKNKDTINTTKRNLERKYKLSSEYRAIKSLRRRMSFVLHGKRKSARSLELVGCTADELKVYLEKQFTLGMTWNNYGLNGWHIDHIRPCESFDLSSPEQQKKCFHYSNLQPLWAKDNLLKGKTYTLTL